MSKEVILKIRNRYIPIPENHKPDIQFDNGRVIVEIKPFSDFEPNHIIRTPLENLGEINEAQINIINSRMPEKDDIKTFILSQENYKHNIHQIAEHFFGIKIPYIRDKKETKKMYDKLWRRIDRTRNEISRKEHGKWKIIPMGFGNPKIYSFVRI